MEQSSAVDIDWLLQSHDEEDDLAVPEIHLRTVDEILLNHSSPSPPSSPSTSASASFLTHSNSPRRQKEDDGLSNSLTSSHDISLLELDGVKSYSSAVVSKSKYAGRVLPHLLGTGVIRSNSKPGAALEAAAAASRSFPTPHAVAIKLRQASYDVTRSEVSDTAILTAGRDEVPLSPSSLPSKGSGYESDAVTDSKGCGVDDVGSGKTEVEEEINLQQSEFSKREFIAGIQVSQHNLNEADEVLTNLKTIMEVSNVGKALENVKQEECTSSNLESENPFLEIGKNYVIDEVNGGIPEVLPLEELSQDRETVEPYPDIDDITIPDNNELGELITEHGGNEDFTSSLNDVQDFFPAQGNKTNERGFQQNSPSLKPLALAEEIEKKQAFTGLHYEEGAAAQPMRLEGVQRGSTVVGYFDVSAANAITRAISAPTFRHDHGSPQVVAVHLNCIAVGMSKGTIFLVPSKYNAHHVDNMNSKITLLGLQGDRSHISVTSMCFNQQGDLLFAGYGDGHYTVWDVQKVSALKVVTEHRAPVVHLLYLGQDSQVTRQFNVVSGDSKGVVKLIKFSVVPWLNMISYTKSVKLFDETTSRVLFASPLLFGECHGGSVMSQGSGAVSSGSINSNMGGIEDEGVVVFITHQSALVVKVSPTVKVYTQIPRPDGAKESAMPYAALKCIPQPPGHLPENAHNEASDNTLWLAIAWDQKILVGKIVKSELKMLEKWNLEDPAIGVAWLDAQMLVVLTLTAQLYLFANDGNLIHRTSFSVDGCLWDDLISYHIYFSNVSGIPERAYQNSVAVRGATIYILGPVHFVVSRLLSWKERIEVLQKAGDWMGALNMGISFYDGESHGVIDLPKNLDDVRTSVMPFLVELIQSYVSEAFSYMSVAYCKQNGSMEQSDDIKEHYTHVGGVAVEYCVHIKRTDILFEDILSKFEHAQNKETFLELLEPYILKDMLGSLPPEVMQALVEHYNKRGWLQRVEQCVLHMDILSLDFNQVVLLCREHRLHGALIYLFNKGLDDFRTPIEELLAILRSSGIENASSLGYRMLVYLKYCFQGLAFPPGHGNLSPSRVPSVRTDLLQFLLEASKTPNEGSVTGLPSNGVSANLIYLLKLDTEATLDVLKCAFTEDELPLSTKSPLESTNVNMESAQSKKLVQNIVDILAKTLEASCNRPMSPLCCDIENARESWPSRKDVCYIYEYIAYYVASERANISKDILCKILEYLMSEVEFSNHASLETIEILRRKELQLISLLKVVPEAHWDVHYLLNLGENVQFHQVCGYIQSIRHQYVDAMLNYMKIASEPIHAFSFIQDMLLLLSDEEYINFESAVISHISDLIKLSREGTYFLITNHFPGKIHYFLSELRSHPESLFLYLKTVIQVHKTGTLDLSCLKKYYVSDFPCPKKTQQQSTGVEAYLNTISNSLNLLRDNEIHVTDEMMELYFEFLCQYERESVLKFLETSESYRVEHCLRLCQEYGIVDAASFLFERVGDVGSALLLILSNLNYKFVTLESEILKGYFDSSLDNLSAILNKKVVAEILDIVHSCLGLCQRNSPRLDPDESEYLWFQLLDSFFDPLIDSSNDKSDYERKVGEVALDGSLSVVENEEKYNTKRKASKPRKVAQMMRKLFSVFIKEIVEGMIGYVRLPRIMLKLLSDNGNQEFGDFKLTILGMLGTYDFERKILDTAKSLIEDDTYYIMSLLRKGASHGYAPQSLTCCICNSLLAKASSDSSIRVFSCGHAMHLYCEFEKNEASHRGTLTGCPICNFRKKTGLGSSDKAVFVDNGLVSKFSSRIQQSGGMSASHPHDHDSHENIYLSHPASTFELLTNLQKDQKSLQFESTTQLRLAPPALYHEKVKKQAEIFNRKGTNHVSSTEKSSSSKKSRDVKLKGSSLRSTLKKGVFRELLHPIG